MSCYVFLQEPTQSTYFQLVDFCASLASHALLVVRDPELDPVEEVARKLTVLEPFLIRKERRREWPGTTLLFHDATVYTYSVHGAFKGVLQGQVPSLFAWIHPDAPEDPCFLRSTGEPLLVTTSHEQDAYLLLSSQEIAVLRHTFPEVAALLREE